MTDEKEPKTPPPERFNPKAPTLYTPKVSDVIMSEQEIFSHDDVTAKRFLKPKELNDPLPYEWQEEYNPHFAIAAQNLALLGLSLSEIADTLGFPPEAIDAWYKNEEMFKAAFDSGGIIADATVARSIYKRAVGYTHKETKIHFSKDGFVTEHEVEKHYPPDANAALTWLKLRQNDKWEQVEKVEHQHQIMTIAKDEEEL